jgi:hypothetical protein
MSSTVCKASGSAKQGVRVPTIPISRRLDASTREHASILGVTRVIEKPFAVDDLADLIRTALLERD